MRSRFVAASEEKPFAIAFRVSQDRPTPIDERWPKLKSFLGAGSLNPLALPNALDGIEQEFALATALRFSFRVEEACSRVKNALCFRVRRRSFRAQCHAQAPRRTQVRGDPF
jgi:hypothetical protein